MPYKVQFPQNAKYRVNNAYASRAPTDTDGVAPIGRKWGLTQPDRAIARLLPTY